MCGVVWATRYARDYDCRCEKTVCDLCSLLTNAYSKIEQKPGAPSRVRGRGVLCAPQEHDRPHQDARGVSRRRMPWQAEGGKQRASSSLRN